MDDWKKAVSVILAFLVFYSVFGSFNFFNYGTVNNGQDFEFHWGRLQGEIERPYPRGYHFLFSIFAGHQLLFYFANVVLICVAIPGLLFLISKRWEAVVIYFCGISLPHQLLYGATYPQALVLFYFLIYLLFRKNWKMLLILTGLAALTHNQGLYLFAGIWSLEIVALGLNYLKIKRKKFIDECTDRFTNVGWLGPSQMIGLKGLIELVFLQIPLPVLIYGIVGAGSLFYLALVIGSVSMAGLDFRAISVAQLICVIGCSKILRLKPRNLKIGFVLFLVFQLIFYLLDYAGGTWKYIVFN